jgi:hypothetical protein
MDRSNSRAFPRKNGGRVVPGAAATGDLSGASSDIDLERNHPRPRRSSPNSHSSHSHPSASTRALSRHQPLYKYMNNEGVLMVLLTLLYAAAALLLRASQRGPQREYPYSIAAILSVSDVARMLAAYAAAVSAGEDLFSGLQGPCIGEHGHCTTHAPVFLFFVYNLL